MSTENNSKAPENKNINFTNRNAVEKFLEGEQFRPCDNLKCSPVELEHDVLYMPMCMEGRFHREGVAEVLDMPLPPRPLSPVTYTTIPIWAPLVSCPHDCKGYENRTVAKFQRSVSSAIRWLFRKDKAHSSGTTQEKKKWWQDWIVLTVTGVIAAVIAGLILWAIIPRLNKLTSPATASSESQPEQKKPETTPAQPSTDDVKPMPAKPPRKVASGNVSNPANTDKRPVTQLCPNGICIGGDNKGDARVYNFGPPPPPIPTVTICVTHPTGPEGTERKTVLKFETDVEIMEAWYALFFDGPVGEGTVEMPTGSFGYTHGRADKMPNPENSFVFRSTSINFGVARWLPNNPLKVTIPSKDPVNLVKVLSGSAENGRDEIFVYRCP